MLCWGSEYSPEVNQGSATYLGLFWVYLTLTTDVRFPIEDPCFLVGELDGVRLISSTNQELLQEVPLVCQDIFKIASMAPGALLLEAHREYEVRTSHSNSLTPIWIFHSHQNICVLVLCRNRVRRLMSTSGKSRSKTCSERRSDSVWRQQDMNMTPTPRNPSWGWDPAKLKLWSLCLFCALLSCFLYQAASFGKCFVTDFCPDLFVSTCRELRVLNAVRESSVGLPLTHTQYPHTHIVIIVWLRSQVCLGQYLTSQISGQVPNRFY